MTLRQESVEVGSENPSDMIAVQIVFEWPLNLTLADLERGLVDVGRLPVNRIDIGVGRVPNHMESFFNKAGIENRVTGVWTFHCTMEDWNKLNV